MKTRPNSYDVGRVAGVSRSVVSAVLNGRADRCRIAKKTQERVQAAIRELGYTPNYFIRNMFLKRRELVGVQGAGAPETVSAVVTPALTAAGYRVQVIPLAADPATAFAQVTAALKLGMVALIAPAAEASFAAQPESVPVPKPTPASRPGPAPETTR